MDKRRNDTTSKIIDNILRFTVLGGVISVGVAAPNLLQVLDKPLNKYLKHLDQKERERETRRLISYMKSRDLLSGDYKHGLQITGKGRDRLSKLDFDKLVIAKPEIWDKNWRLVFFDIPEEYKSGRNALTAKLHNLGFMQLQKSVWIHPFPCREVIEKIANTYEIDKYITYVETAFIDNQKHLIVGFKNILAI